MLKNRKMETLDRFDIAILAELQNDARLTNAELASRVGLSAAPCWRRVKALEQAGIELVPISIFELTNGFGGPNCLCLPLVRAS